MAGTPSSAVLDQYLRESYHILQAVHDALPQIKAVAGHLTPVSDLLDFQVQVEAVYVRLGLLVEASENVIDASAYGITLLKAIDAATARTLLQLKSAALSEAADFASATAFTTLSASVTQLRSDVDALIAQGVGGGGSVPADLQAQLDSLKTRVSALENNAALITRIDELEAGLAALGSDITVINTTLGTQSTAIDGLTLRTGTLEGTVSTQATSLTSLRSDLTALDGRQTSTASALQTLTTTVTQNDAKRQSTADAVTLLDSRLDTAEAGIAGQSSALNQLTTRVTETESGLEAHSQDLTVLRASLGSGGNHLVNPGFETDSHGWTLFSKGAGWDTATLVRTPDPAKLPLGMQALSVAVTGTPTGSAGVRSVTVPVEALKRYILSTYLAADGCTTRLECRVFNLAGQEIGFHLVGSSLVAPPLSRNLADWARPYVVIPMPADAATVQLQWWTNAVTAADPKPYLLRPMLEQALPEQTRPSPWTPSAAGLDDKFATAVSALEVRVTDVEAVSGGSTELTARIEDLESALTQEIITSANRDGTHAATLNSLGSRMTDAEGSIVANADAVSGLTTRVTNTETTVSSHSSQITNLQTQVNAMDADTGGYGSAISALDTRVTATENDIDTHSQQITSLQNSVTSANKIFVQPSAPATSGRTVNDLWIDSDDNNKPYFFDGTGWVARPDNAKNRVFVQSTAPTATAVNDLWVHTGDSNKLFRWNGSAWVDITDARITGNASAISSLTSRVTTAEGTITSQGQSITTLQNTVNHPTTGVSATASAVSSLTTRVSDAEGDISSQASSLQSLTTTVNGNSATISQHATSINGLKAQWSVQLDVNGYVSGLYSANNGSTSEFTVLASTFKIVTPGAAALVPFEVRNGVTYIKNAAIDNLSITRLGAGTLNGDMALGTGRIIFDNGTVMKVQGIGFGSANQFIEWFGPKMALTACTEANAIQYLKTDGSAYFGGALHAGVLKNAATSTQVSATASVETGVFGTNGKQKVVTYSLSHSHAFNTTTNLGGTSATSCTVVLERSLDGGAWVEISRFTGSGQKEYLRYEEGRYYYQVSAGGSSTYTDNTAGTSTFNYRARVIAASGWPIAHPQTGQTGSQNLTVISVEQ